MSESNVRKANSAKTFIKNMDERWRNLRGGDKVRLLCVPAADLRQRERELRDGAEMAGWTADTLERILATNPIVEIDEVDGFGAPWFPYQLTASNGTVEHHHLTITDDESWELILA